MLLERAGVRVDYAAATELLLAAGCAAPRVAAPRVDAPPAPYVRAAHQPDGERPVGLACLATQYCVATQRTPDSLYTCV